MTFPPLDAVERAQSERVLAAVRERVRAAGGWLPFSEYQNLVLYAPGLGYYSAGAAKFGAAGDFVTAPEISPLFGRAVARWIAPLLAACGPRAEILELGAGSGALARTLLAELTAQGCAPARYSILEISGDLRARQVEALAETSASTVVRWSDRLPENFVGVILANEVLDALPCERFVQGPAGLLARGVGVSSTGELTEVLRDPRLTKDLHLPAAETLHAVYAAMADRLRSSVCDLPLGYAGEFIPSMTPFVQSLSAALTRGAVVLVDYGLPRRQLYLPERSAGSLRCIRRHHAHEDAFRDAGLTDITSWVDFTHLAEAAGQSGLELRAFATQMAWMLDAGIERLLADQLAVGLSATQHQNLVQGVKTLLLPGEMGEAVKMLCLVRDLARGLGVVATQDLTASL